MKKITLLFLLLIPFVTFGQSFIDTISDTQAITDTRNIFIETSPENPGSFTNTSVKVNSFSIDLTRAYISWFINGEIVKEGIGERNIEVETGYFGEERSIVVRVQTVDGFIIDTSTVLRPIDVDILWESTESYTPSWYKGKALASRAGNMRLIALPQIITKNEGFIPPENLFFSWEIEGEILSNKSGYGKYILDLDPSIVLQSLTVKLTVSTINRSISIQKGIVINMESPSLLTYVEEGDATPLPIKKGLGIATKDDIIKFVAEPFFSNTLGVNDKKNGYWSLNEGATVQPGKEVLISRPTSAKAEKTFRLTYIYQNSSILTDRISGNYVLEFVEK